MIYWNLHAWHDRCKAEKQMHFLISFYATDREAKTGVLLTQFFFRELLQFRSSLETVLQRNQTHFLKDFLSKIFRIQNVSLYTKTAFFRQLQRQALEFIPTTYLTAFTMRRECSPEIDRLFLIRLVSPSPLRPHR